jgi:hypothetical protein
MYSNFASYRNLRDKIEFSKKFDNLCETIALSGVPFRQYWESHGLPTLLRSQIFESTDELINEFGLGALGRMFGFGKQAPQANTPMPQWIQDADGPTQAANAQQAKIANAKKGLAPIVDNIKKQFMMAMRNFQQQVTSTAQDPKSFGIAKNFYQYMMKVLEPQAEKYLDQLKINFLPQGQQPGYAQQFGDMQKGQQAGRTADMKQQLTQKMSKLTGVPPQFVTKIMSSMGAKTPEDIKKAWAQIKDTPAVKQAMGQGPAAAAPTPEDNWNAKNQASQQRLAKLGFGGNSDNSGSGPANIPVQPQNPGLDGSKQAGMKKKQHKEQRKEQQKEHAFYESLINMTQRQNNYAMWGM